MIKTALVDKHRYDLKLFIGSVSEWRKCMKEMDLRSEILGYIPDDVEVMLVALEEDKSTGKVNMYFADKRVMEALCAACEYEFKADTLNICYLIHSENTTEEEKIWSISDYLKKHGVVVLNWSALDNMLKYGYAICCFLDSQDMLRGLVAPKMIRNQIDAFGENESTGFNLGYYDEVVTDFDESAMDNYRTQPYRFSESNSTFRVGCGVSDLKYALSCDAVLDQTWFKAEDTEVGLDESIKFKCRYMHGVMFEGHDILETYLEPSGFSNKVDYLTTRKIPCKTEFTNMDSMSNCRFLNIEMNFNDIKEIRETYFYNCKIHIKNLHDIFNCGFYNCYVIIDNVVDNSCIVFDKLTKFTKIEFKEKPWKLIVKYNDTSSEITGAE